MTAKCAVEDCHTPSRARGWCPSHYERWRKWGDPLAAAKTRNDRVAERRDYVVGEIEWMRSFGVSGDLIAEQLGMTNEAIVKSLNRWGRSDLSELFLHRQEESWFNQWLEGKHRVA